MSKFISLDKYDGGHVRFGDDKVAYIVSKKTILIERITMIVFRILDKLEEKDCLLYVNKKKEKL